MKLVNLTAAPIPCVVLMSDDGKKCLGHIRKYPHTGVWQAKVHKGYQLKSFKRLFDAKKWILDTAVA